MVEAEEQKHREEVEARSYTEESASEFPQGFIYGHVLLLHAVGMRASSASDSDKFRSAPTSPMALTLPGIYQTLREYFL